MHVLMFLIGFNVSGGVDSSALISLAMRNLETLVILESIQFYDGTSVFRKWVDEVVSHTQKKLYLSKY